MFRKARTWLLVLALLWGSAERVSAQTPIPVANPTAPAPTARVTPSAYPAATWQEVGPNSGAPACACYEDRNGPMLFGDPLLDSPCESSPGWYVAAEVGLLHPVYKNRLIDSKVVVPGLGEQTVSLPTAELDWTGSPQLDLGYRLAQGFGSFQLSYRSLVTSGSGTIPGFDAAGAGALTSRLNLNVADFDYATREFSLGSRWDMKWRVGARVVTNYFDSRAQGAILGEHVSNNLIAGGPHVALELQRRMEIPNLSLLGRFEFAMVTGRIEQTYQETISVGGVPVVGGADKAAGSQYNPIPRVQTGLCWTPSWRERHLQIMSGYEFEAWWWVGHLSGPANTALPHSTANLLINGVFLRAQYNY